ncbi:MAG: hypothetical protein KDE14_16695, partial [Rhodobacteraceae bacterium]|nr:hypothetical protein [Paracoccaceae bacterium]
KDDPDGALGRVAEQGGTRKFSAKHTAEFARGGVIAVRTPQPLVYTNSCHWCTNWRLIKHDNTGKETCNARIEQAVAVFSGDHGDGRRRSDFNGKCR